MTNTPSSAARRGWCPGIRRPMATGDGLLARLHPPGGALTGTQARALAAAARTCGNGLIDISARGNLQIRGLSEATYGEFLARLAEASLGYAEREAEREPVHAGPLRLTVASPLAGLDPADHLDARALAAAIETEASAIEGLPPKICVAVDGGGALPLDGVAADLQVVALDPIGAPLTSPHRGEVRVAIGFAAPADVHWAGTTILKSVPGAIAALLTAFAQMRRTGVAATRFRALAPADRRRLVASVPFEPPVVPPTRPAGPKAGIVDLGSGLAAVLLALPFGRTAADGLDRVAAWSERFGTGELRLAPWRGIAIAGVAHRDAPALLAAARDHGLIVDPHDPRLSVFACPGGPACAAGTTATHAHADAFAVAARDLIATGLTFHVSGCAKGCAHPGRADLTLVGEAGAYGVVLGGTPRDAPVVRLPADSIRDRLSSIHSPAGLQAAFRETWS